MKRKRLLFKAAIRSLLASHYQLLKATVRNLLSGNSNMALEYFNSWDFIAYGLSQACTAGITEPL